MSEVRRINADVIERKKDGRVTIEVPMKPGAIKTVVTVVLGEDGRVHVAGPVHEPELMRRLLKQAMQVNEEYQRTRLVQPIQGVVGRG